jgi:hypothetical protein
MDDSAAHITPVVRISPTNDDDVGWHPQLAQGAMETNRLLSLVCDLGLYD